MLIFLALEGKIQGKKIVKLCWAITFDWSVLRTLGQEWYSEFGSFKERKKDSWQGFEKF